MSLFAIALIGCLRSCLFALEIFFCSFIRFSFLLSVVFRLFAIAVIGCLRSCLFALEIFLYFL